MLRTAFLFFCLLGFLAADIQAARAETAATSALVHRRKPMAGNYRPVYKTYKGHSRNRKGLFRFFRKRPTAKHSGSRKHRGTM
jgi:hypothetical protein